MTSTRSRTRQPDTQQLDGARWHGEGFGVVLHGSYPIVGLAQGEGPASGDGTALLLDRAAAASPGGERLRELRTSDGSLGMAIDDCGELGLRIESPQAGAHQISRDGRTVRSSPGEPPAWRWQRLLVGQVLPLVAALRGLEVLHASAVAHGGVAFAFAGNSGAGKSTLAAHLALRGHPMVTDDVLAISVGANGHPQAHRGSTALALSREDAELAAELVGSGTATAIGSDAKDHLLLSGADRRMQLGAIYRVGNQGTAEPPVGVPRTATLSDLMSFSYINYIRTPARLTAQLEVLAAIAQHCAIVPLNVGAGLTAAQLAAELEPQMATIANASVTGW